LLAWFIQVPVRAHPSPLQGRITFEEARGLAGVKEATITIPVGADSKFKVLEPAPGAGVTLRIAVANGLGNAKKVGAHTRRGIRALRPVERHCPGFLVDACLVEAFLSPCQLAQQSFHLHIRPLFGATSAQLNRGHRHPAPAPSDSEGC
jgi:hypothetical protein